MEEYELSMRQADNTRYIENRQRRVSRAKSDYFYYKNDIDHSGSVD
jgi:hypothetical protein